MKSYFESFLILLGGCFVVWCVFTAGVNVIWNNKTVFSFRPFYTDAGAMQLERGLNDVTLFGTLTNRILFQQVPALVSLQDTLDMVSHIAPYFQNYDSFAIEKIQPERFISGSTYSVTNDSAVYVVSFFSPTKQRDWHLVYLNNNYSAVELAQ